MNLGSMKKKILLGVGALIVAALIGGGVVFSRNPHLPAIIDEGFPVAVWPAKGIYLRVTGVPRPLGKSVASLLPVENEWSEKLRAMNIERETDALLAFHKAKLKYASE